MKKMGFTLIELLAVIVILAIIAVITVPKIADMIETSREGAAEDSFYGALKAAELSYARTWQSNNELKETTCNFEENVTCTNGVTFSSSGANPKSGRITIIDSYPYGSELEYNGYTCTGSLESEHPCIKKGTTKPECFSTENNSDGSLSITDYDTKCGTDVVIPAKINGKKVTKIADGKYNSSTGVITGVFKSKGITSVKIPDTITYIGYAAFLGNKIENLEIPSSVERIAIYAFSSGNIKSLKLNYGIKILEDQAFSNNQLTHVDLPDSLTRIGMVAFSNNLLTDISIPKNVVYLGGGAFSKNPFPDNTKFVYGRKSDGTEDNTILNSYASKQNIETLNIPSTITKIENYCFNTININKIVIPSNVKIIGNYTFSGSNATEVTLSENLTSMGAYSFYGIKATNINIPSTVTSIGYNALNISTLKTININRTKDSIDGSPWGAPNATINWTGTNY